MKDETMSLGAAATVAAIQDACADVRAAWKEEGLDALRLLADSDWRAVAAARQASGISGARRAAYVLAYATAASSYVRTILATN